MADLDVRARKYLISSINDFNSANDIIDAIKSSGGAGGAVSSVFNRQGDVIALTGDYTAAQVTNAVSTLGSYADPVWIVALAGSKISGDITGNSSSINGTITESQVVGLIADLANKAPLSMADKNYVFNQASATATWNINHNLNKYPSIHVVDSAQTVVVGDVKYIDLNNITVTFASGFAGQAFLN